MDKNDAIEFNNEGLRFVNLGKYTQAIDCFSKAIEADPNYAAAYKNRGEAYILLDRYVEGNTDIHKSKEISNGKGVTKSTQETLAKMNMQEVDSIYDTIFSDEVAESKDDTGIEYDSNFFDYVFSDESNDEEYLEQVAETLAETKYFPAILEYIGGKRIEADRATLLTPTNDTLTILDDQTGREQVVPIDQLACIRISEIPSQLADKVNRSGSIEIIETIDGNIYNELINPSQDLDNLLFGFSTEDQSSFSYSFIPMSNIKKRSQKRLIGEILVDKRYIANNILNKALEEFHNLKNMRLGKIIARKARILHSKIEEELEKAKQNKLIGLRTGEILLLSGLVNEQQIMEAMSYQEEVRKLKIGQFLVQKGIVKEKEVYIALAEKHRIPYIDLSKLKLSKNTLTLLPKQMIVENEILPVALKDNTLVIATHEVESKELCEQLLIETKCHQVRFALTQPTYIKNFIGHFYQ